MKIVVGISEVDSERFGIRFGSDRGWIPGAPDASIEGIPKVDLGRSGRLAPGG
jgi:hypothetical protein